MELNVFFKFISLLETIVCMSVNALQDCINMNGKILMCDWSTVL